MFNALKEAMDGLMQEINKDKKGLWKKLNKGCGFQGKKEKHEKVSNITRVIGVVMMYSE